MECAVVPVRDSIRLSIPKAFITLRDGREPSREASLSIFKYIRGTLAPYKRIRRIEFIDLPKTVSGKIRRAELRRSEAGKSGDSSYSSEFREDDFPELRLGYMHQNPMNNSSFCSFFLTVIDMEC
jgi:acetyl-CoA synthetase